MFFDKSITFGEEELNGVALAAGSNAGSLAELEFIEKLKAGDERAFDLLVTRYSSDIYGLLLRMTNDVDEAQELTQETFLRALKAIGRFRGEADLKTWLYRIAINESRNRWRWWKRRNKSGTVSLDAERADCDVPLSDRISDGKDSPETETLQRERRHALLGALNELPQIFREAIVLRDIQGLSYEEVAATLKMNVGTVKSRIARGREELRRKLQGF